LFQELFLDYAPDLVVWGYGFNDQSPMQWMDVADINMIPLAPGLKPEGATWSRRLEFWLIRRPLTQAIRTFILPPLWRAKYAKFLEMVQKYDLSSSVAFNAEFYHRSRVPPPKYMVHLLEMDRLSKERHFQLMVASFWGTPAVYRDTAKEFCRIHRVPYLDLTNDFARIFQTRSLADQPEYAEMFQQHYAPYLKPGTLEKQPMFFYTTDNLHPNVVGGHVIVRAMADFINLGP
jgi:hypothetical protein